MTIVSFRGWKPAAPSPPWRSPRKSSRCAATAPPDRGLGTRGPGRPAGRRPADGRPPLRGRGPGPRRRRRPSPSGGAEAFFEHNNHHHRAGIGLHTPASVHFGTATEIRAQRAETLDRCLRRQPVPVRQPPAQSAEAGCPPRRESTSPPSTTMYRRNPELVSKTLTGSASDRRDGANTASRRGGSSSGCSTNDRGRSVPSIQRPQHRCQILEHRTEMPIIVTLVVTPSQSPADATISSRYQSARPGSVRRSCGQRAPPHGSRWRGSSPPRAP